jgi:hypothetical protein
MTDETIPAMLAPDPPMWDDAMLALITTDSTDRAVVAARDAEIARIEDAEWAMRRLAELEDDVAEAKAHATAWRAPIDDWLDKQTAAPKERAAFLRRKLEAFGITQRMGNPRLATIPVPSGEIATRQAKEPTVIVVDEATLIEWCEDTLPGFLFDDVVKTEQSVRVSELRKCVAVELVPDEDGVTTYRVTFADGEVEHDVPGVEVEPPVTTATVKPLR